MCYAPTDLPVLRVMCGILVCLSLILICGVYCAGKELKDPRVLTDVGDVPVQEIRDCGVDDDRLMNVISESVKLVMEEVSYLTIIAFQLIGF